MVSGEMNRKEEQANLIYKVGLLAKPIVDVVADPQKFNSTTRALIRAKFIADHAVLTVQLKSFFDTEPGHDYSAEWRDIRSGLVHLTGPVTEMFVNWHEEFPTQFEKYKQELVSAIIAVPVPVEGATYESHTPFSTYCKLHPLFQTVKTQLIYADRYVDHTIFHRYLRDVPDGVKVTLVTWPLDKHSKNYSSTFTAFMDISRIYAKERGPDKYRLFVVPGFHDRWLRCDDQLFHLGGSIKDAGSNSAYTLSRIDPSPENMKTLDDLLNAENEWFGPKQLNHK